MFVGDELAAESGAKRARIETKSIEETAQCSQQGSLPLVISYVLVLWLAQKESSVLYEHRRPHVVEKVKRQSPAVVSSRVR